MKDKEVELGDLVKDRVSGFQGIVTGYSTWLTGCDSVHLTEGNVTGKDPVQVTIDVTRAEIVEKQKVKLQFQNTREEAEKPKRAKAPGGPHTVKEHVG